jgi:hypothetical protein
VKQEEILARDYRQDLTLFVLQYFIIFLKEGYDTSCDDH